MEQNESIQEEHTLKLTFEGSKEGIERLIKLFEEGKLDTIGGFKVIAITKTSSQT